MGNDDALNSVGIYSMSKIDIKFVLLKVQA